ncbi:MAG: peptidoglycan-binding domain-containing protein [Alphaproteobacteria bacterium]|nr:peptidoglycan-binding domain-containing protein [Alphaproteobacteria bacterium]
MRFLRFAVLASALGLAACGSTPEDRAVTGAAIGATGGAIFGAMAGAPGLGAAIGAGVGGVTGALTDKSTLNIGDPIWKQSTSGQVSGVKQIQSGLIQLGYDPGPADGYHGAKTSAAIREYQKNNGLLVDGRASPELLNHINENTGRG